MYMNTIAVNTKKVNNVNVIPKLQWRSHKLTLHAQQGGYEESHNDPNPN